MSVYKAINGPRGSLRYQKDRRLIARDKIPVTILVKLTDAGVQISDRDVVQVAPKKACLFCGAPSKLTRLVNLQTVYLCDTHYYDKTTGRIAQEIRSKQNG